MKKQPKRNISVRIDQDSYDALCRIAKEDYRTVSGLVFYWIRQCIREYDNIRNKKAL